MSYQTITAEGIAKRKNSLIVRKTSLENETRVFSQVGEYFTKSMSKITLNQYDIPMESAAPAFPRFNLKIKAQQRGKWKSRDAIELQSIGSIKL